MEQRRKPLRLREALAMDRGKRVAEHQPTERVRKPRPFLPETEAKLREWLARKRIKQ